MSEQDASWLIPSDEIYSDELQDPEVQGDVALQGQQLYLDFLRREIRSQELEEPASLSRAPSHPYRFVIITLGYHR